MASTDFPRKVKYSKEDEWANMVMTDSSKSNIETVNPIFDDDDDDDNDDDDDDDDGGDDVPNADVDADAPSSWQCLSARMVFAGNKMGIVRLLMLCHWQREQGLGGPVYCEYHWCNL